MKIKHFFTLIELLIVIAIIAILASLLLPSLRKARERGKTIACNSNLKQLGSAVNIYSTDFDAYYPPCPSNANNDTWQIKLDGYLFEYTGSIWQNAPGVLRCPAQKNSEEANYDCILKGDYGLNRYVINMFEENEARFGYGYIRAYSVKFPSVYVLGGDEDGVWQRDLYSSDLTVDAPLMRHFAGTNFVFMDGHCTHMTYKNICAEGYNLINNWRYGWRDGMIY